MALPAPGYLSNAERTNAEMKQALEDQRDYIAGIVGAVSTLTASAALTANQLGLVLIDATAGNVTVTLPESNAALGIRDVILRRTDGSANTLVVQVSGTDTIMLDTAASPTGQASVSLLHRDDWLYLRSYGAGRWWVIGASMRATDTQRGITRYATKPEVRAGVVPDAAVTPESLSEIADFAMVYPNGGSEASPANISTNSRYVETNPFPGHHIICVAEILVNGSWGIAGQSFLSDVNGSGVTASEYNGGIVVQTGNQYLTTRSATSGNPFGITTALAGPLPCRVKVWKIKG